MAFRFKLDTSSRKFPCPSCGKKRFVRYVDSITGEYMPDNFGRCDRQEKCRYFESPGRNPATFAATEPEQRPPASYHPIEWVNRSLGNYESNSLVKWLATLPGWNRLLAEETARAYNAGTTDNGWAIFWQVDSLGKVRGGKMIKYGNDGRRVKTGYAYDWVHANLKRSGELENFELVQCFYGLHLVDKNKPVAIVESEKTAIIASQYLTQFTWIATGALHGLTEYKMMALRGRKVALFPDVGAYDQWQEKAIEFRSTADIQVSDLLERMAGEEDAGYDIADYLIRHDLRGFRANTKPHPNRDKPAEAKFEPRFDPEPETIHP